MSWARSIRVSLGVVALGLASGGHASSLFLPVAGSEPKSAIEGRYTASPAKKGERRVRIARHELKAAHDDVENTGTGRLLLNMRGGVRLDVVVERTAPTRWGYSLSGRISGANVGFVTLVVHEEAVAGSIWTPDAEYELNYLGGGVHALKNVTNAPPVECAGALPSELSAADAAQGSTDDGSVVDILVVWTPKLMEQEYGGSGRQMLSRIDMLVAYTNDAFERSGAFVALNLVGAEKVDYVETDSDVLVEGLRTDVYRLARRDDGYMDSVHDRRDALGADLVYLLRTVRTGTGGVALGAFSVGSVDSYIFAHEVGHNLGLNHERFEAPFPAQYNNGFSATTGRCSATIMSYGQECRRSALPPLYASPWRYDPRNGHAVGVTRFSKERGARGPADAVLALNRNRHKFANFRPSRNGD